MVAWMQGCIGRHQRQVRRCLVAAGGEPVRTAELMRWCWPRKRELERWRWNDVIRAAHRFGINVRRGWWAPNDELLRQIRGEADGSSAHND
jgi:hypothetical protein